MQYRLTHEGGNKQKVDDMTTKIIVSNNKLTTQTDTKNVASKLAYDAVSV